LPAKQHKHGGQRPRRNANPLPKRKAKEPVYNHRMAKDVIHISEAEAASDFASLMARVRAGAEIVIENGARPVAVLHAAEPVRRSISDCIALAKVHEEETGKAPVLDPDFADDVEEILSHRKPWNPPAWE
jgi:antitoxin (DNA-binding transcriptional repressor) of toxin-antitoxin stability system